MSKKTKEKGTHEFFPRTKVNPDSTSFIFNKAPLNKRDAYEETKTKITHEHERKQEDKM
jgi:hypothetical protein